MKKIKGIAVMAAMWAPAALSLAHGIYQRIEPKVLVLLALIQ